MTPSEQLILLNKILDSKKNKYEKYISPNDDGQTKVQVNFYVEGFSSVKDSGD